jgi:hypothetical protein
MASPLANRFLTGEAPLSLSKGTYSLILNP